LPDEKSGTTNSHEKENTKQKYNISPRTAARNLKLYFSAKVESAFQQGREEEK